MARTKSNPLAKGKTKAHRLPLRALPRLAALRSLGKVLPQLQASETLNISNGGRRLLKERYKTSMQMIPTDQCTTPCHEQASEEHEVIALISDSEHEKDGNLEADAEGALPTAEGGGEEILPKNNVYNAPWAMLDADSENEVKKFLINGTSTAFLTIGER
ncbi:hypothetical protein PIB30_100448 [Stylosanthes scabra]|uniref:Uncharacterized protein n=1 Tax=Stylosanthes scabra TaxID=79078 RepID=A0ABU6XUP8_9FABA|nr:hypothetical protein [Stylosanthes scabra]